MLSFGRAVWTEIIFWVENKKIYEQTKNRPLKMYRLRFVQKFVSYG